MKKNFFKKLSFVLALAMIVSVLAPAAGAFAAKAPKLNASSKTLHLGVDGKDEFDFNISNKVTGWKYKWSSANKDVVTVNKSNGITTATGAGKTQVSVVITDKKGEEVAELTASVLVRDNIKELTITNLPEDGKVAVGVAHDFNRSYVTVANKKKGSQAITRWTVSPSEDATITDSGVFTANKAGEYTITARSFQSKAKYTSWLTDATKYASYVTAEATYKVTVAPSMVKVAQTTLKKFDVTFDSAMTKEDVTKNLVVSYVLGGTKVKESVKSVSMSEDGKTATVEMYLDFTKGVTYSVEYPNMGTLEFVSATTKVEDVVSMEILTKSAQIGKETKLNIALYDKNNVNIANSDLLARVVVKKADKSTAISTLLDKVLYMHKLGEVLTLEATFHTYNWKDGKEVGNVTITGDVTCVEVVKDQAGTIHGWTVQTNAPTNFNSPKTQIFKNDPSKPLYVVLKGKNADGDDMYTSNFTYTGTPTATRGVGNWKYTSSNTNVLLVDAAGNVYGVSEGTAVVVVTYDDVQVGACEITVTAARKLAMAELSKNSLTLSNKFSDLTSVTFKAKDQLSDDYKTAGGAYNATVSVTENFSRSSGNVYPQVLATATGLTVDANPTGAVATASTAGTYGYTVKITDNADSNNSISLNFTVTVQDPGTLTTSYYKIEADDVSYEVKSGTSAATTTAQLSIYGYTAAGVKYEKLTGFGATALAGYTLTVKNPNGNTVTGSAINGGSIINASNQIVLAGTDTTSVSGKTIVKTEKAGSWLITLTNTASGATPVHPVSFEVKNSQPKITYSVKRSVSNDITTTADIAALINDCISFSVNDKAPIADSATIGTDYTVVGKNVTLRKIKIYEELTPGSNVWVQHEVDFGGLVISIK